MFKRCDSTESDFCCAPLSCRAGAPPKEPKPPNDPFFSALPDSALPPCDQAEPDFCGAGSEERLPKEPNDVFFDDVDRLLLVGLDFWEENPLLNELEPELDRELELDDGFAAAVTVVAAGSSSASSNMIWVDFIFRRPG
ncbi:hypothetical protein HF313_00080 [Massilia atriviolacea]|uniref:Uncharacterized protein n=1 Tax=Massilia atriviolacea TaxID=2495579 RepID=A0A430HKV9_9BURK|nr:hypothetical protein [Massilia atriviolacea]RSZ58143.1 hypothetical protein EJB06_14305 [Massilia atriviolacea]